MQIQEQDHFGNGASPDHAVLALQGNLSVDAADSLRQVAQQKLQQQCSRLVLDCEDLEFIDSRGLEALIWLQERCSELFGRLCLANCPAHIRRVLEVTHLWSRFDCHPSVDDAVASLAA